MLQKMSGACQQGTDVYDIEKNIAASSIALHTKDAYLKAKELIGPGKDDKRIFFENHPFLFLLTYCDTLQEWGRKSTDKVKKSGVGTPVLQSLKSVDNNITCNLSYHTNGKTPPSKAQIEEWARDFQPSFSSLNFNFSINYLSDKHHINNINLKNRLQREGIRIQCAEFFSLQNDKDFYFTNYSTDPISGKHDIGFGTNHNFQKDDQSDIKFIYDGLDLSGEYRVKRVESAKTGLRYKYFVGVEKT